MIKSNIQISIITLVKNDYLKFSKTLKSLKSQIKDFSIEWIVVDGSSNNEFKCNKELINKNFPKEKKNFINHINTFRINMEGIYTCMNYGKKISKGKFIIFLNSGDTFFNNYSLSILFEKTLKANMRNSVIFGQAKIIADKNIYWYFPGKRLKNISKWLNYFEPNHQSMLVSNTLANKYEFPTNKNIIGDGYWKRKILNKSSEVIFIKEPVVNFFLDGVSSSKPSINRLKSILRNKDISFLRKFIFFIKYLFPSKFYFLYNLMQKYKSILIDFLI